MLKYLKLLWNKLFDLKQKEVNSKPIEEPLLNTGIISFALDSKDGILIHSLLPKISTDNANPDTIVSEAERFAEMLLCVNEGLLKKEIIQVLREQYEIEENINQKLLIENILNFWSILYTHYKSEKKIAKNGNKMPLIRPMAVFSTKR